MGHALVTSLASSNGEPLENLLGPADGRYFGAGYRAVEYLLNSVESSDSFHAEALAQVIYPDDWSNDRAGRARTPHVSSIDAVVLPLLLLERITPNPYSVSFENLQVRSISLRSGARAWTETDRVPVSVSVSPSDQSLGAVVGNIRVRIDLMAIPATAQPDVSAMRDESLSVYGGLFQTTRIQTHVCSAPGSEHHEIQGVHLATVDSVRSPARGIGANQWPSLTVIDFLVTMGQLTQALVYASAGLTRLDSGPLWMRTMTVDADVPAGRLPTQFKTTTRILGDRVIDRGGERLHDVLVESVSDSGVFAKSTLAYLESEA